MTTFTHKTRLQFGSPWRSYNRISVGTGNLSSPGTGNLCVISVLKILVSAPPIFGDYMDSGKIILNIQYVQY